MADINYALEALGASASTNRPKSGYPMSQAIDGSDITAGRWDFNSGSYAQIDLGAPQYITSLRMLHGATNYIVYPLLQYSTDGTTFNTWATPTIAGGDETFQTGGITAQYWRWAKGSSGTVAGSLEEMFSWELLGPTDAPPPPENPNCTAMQAWLDGLEAYWVPCVQSWLNDN